MHLSTSRLSVADPTPAESAHLAGCARCRAEQRRVRDFVGHDGDDHAPELAAVPPSERLEVGTRLDRYVVEGVLGEGGMAVVYRARHAQLGSLHAIKVLTVPSKQVRERLLNEGRVQATIRSRNIVPVTDVIDVDGAPGLVMELVEGPTLADLLRREGRLPIAQVDELAAGILSGVAAAHEAGLVHRDLKPGNILLALTAEGLVPKVTDFGLAKVLDLFEAAGARTRSSTTLGTPQYMSPEQIRAAKAVDKRSDVFSLGAILYELVTGRPAFEGDDVMAIFTAITEGRYRPVREVVRDAPDRMVAAIEAALRVDREERPHNVDTLARMWRGVPVGTSPATRSLPVATPRAPGRGARTWLVASAPLVVLATWVLLPDDPATCILMDSRARRSVYDPVTYARGGTNADDLAELLGDLGCTFHRETLGSTWAREAYVLEQRPDLVVIHRSAFFHSLNMEFDFGYAPDMDVSQERWDLLYRTADDKLAAFLGLVGAEVPEAKIIVYSRGSGDPKWPDPAHRAAWVEHLERRFPGLEGDILTMAIEGGVEKGTFANPVVAEEMRRLVKSVLEP